MLQTALICSAAGLLVSADATSNLAAKKELDKFQGTWTVVRVEADGKPLPAEATKGWTLTIDGTKYTLHAGDDTIEGVYQLDPLKNPRAIDALRTKGADKGKSLWGIYLVEGDDLKMCFGEPGRQERPKELTTGGVGGGQRLYVLKRVAKR